MMKKAGFESMAVIQYKHCMGRYAYKLQKYQQMTPMRAKMDALVKCRPVIKRHRENAKLIQYKELLQKVDIEADLSDSFFYYIDERFQVAYTDTVIGNNTPDYAMTVNRSLEELRKENERAANCIGSRNVIILDMVEQYIGRICEKIRESNDMDNSVCSRCVRTFERMKSFPAENLYEALQRILFWNQLLWQTGHTLIGLGRLDKILSSFPAEKDSYEVIKSFLKVLHRHYAFKSSEMLGDTGQIIILGGMEPDGTYFWNEYTELFLKALIDLQLPDPKILVRVSENMPDRLLSLIAESIAAGLGSPLLSDDQTVIPCLMEFGYDAEDAYDYGVSACWEPLIPGRSLEQNNIGNINFGRCISSTIWDKSFADCITYEKVCEIFWGYLDKELEELKISLDRFKWESDPLFTFLMPCCLLNNKDVSGGGAAYNNYGLLSVGLGTAVNSLLNIKRIVFERKEISLQKVADMVKSDYQNKEDWQKMLRQNENVFGRDDDEAECLTREIMEHVEKNLKSYRNCFGGRVKFGLSSPGYISQAADVAATFDGRKGGEPYSTHISASRNESPVELVRFASQLDYSGIKSNGNVVDIVLTPELIKTQKDKFEIFLKGSLKQHFFQMQFNVLSYRLLVDARKHPEKYPGLIVRVWGFSAYFAELPEEYQKQMIERARISEGIEI